MLTRLVAGVAAAALVLAGCGGGGDSGEDATLSGAPGKTTTVAEPPVLVGPPSTTAASPAVVETGPSTTPSTGAPTPATGDAAPRPTSSATPVPPPAPGTYRYDTTGQASYRVLGGAPSPYPAVTTLVVDAPTGTRQRAVRDLKDTSGKGLVVETRLDYRADGLYLESLQLAVSVLLFSDTFEFRPSVPALVLPTGAGPGSSRELTVPGRMAPAVLTVEVLAEEDVRVGGRDLAATVVRLTAATTGEFRARMELTIWLAPSSGLWLKERSASEATSPDGAPLYQSRYEATLRSLTPG